MGETFEKIKRNRFLRAAVTGGTVGLSAGILAVGVFLLSVKLGMAELSVGLIAGICVALALGAGALVGLPLFFLLKTSDKKLAHSLDAEHGLHEKIQTMVEYRESEEDMAALQREDAAEKLKNLPPKKVTFQRIWHYILIPVLACAVFVTALALPGTTVPADGTDVFELSERQLKELNELLADVENSALKADLKVAVKAEIQALVGDLEKSPTEAEMQAYVFDAVAGIDGLFVEANTYRKIFPQLKNDERTVAVASAFASGVAVYTASGLALTEFEHVISFSNGLEGTVEIKVKENLVPVTTSLNLPQGEGLAEEVAALNLAVTLAAERSAVAETDALLGALSAFSEELNALAADIEKGGVGDTTLQMRIGVAVDNFGNKITVALSEQVYNCIMDDYVRRKIADIFGLSIKDFPETGHHISVGESGNSDSGGNKDDEDEDNKGGYGGGDSVYGSDDVIFDPDREEHIKYSEVIGEYYAKMMEQLRDSDLTEEEKQYIYDYFEILLSGVKQPEEDKN